METEERQRLIRTEVRRVERNVAKVVLAIVAMMSLHSLLLLVTDPIYSWCESAGMAHVPGWLGDELMRVLAIFMIAFVCGVLFTRDRWLARTSAVIWVLGLLLYETQMLMSLSGERRTVIFWMRIVIAPLACTAVIVFLFSPCFHDWGRRLRGQS